MSSEEGSIRRSADASRQHATQANETPGQEQNRRTADASQQCDTWENETPRQQQNHRTGNAN